MITAAKSDVGMIRKANEDSFFISDIINDSVVCVVADGMGGHKGGKIASHMAAETIGGFCYEENIFSYSVSDIPSKLDEIISNVNLDIINQANENEQLVGMGTTVVICVARENDVIIANIGDSRAYLVNDKEITQITKDHSMVQELVDMGQISPEEAKGHPNLNIITKALGVEKKVEADYFKLNTAKGDKILLCSDGLTNMVSNQDIHSIITNASSADEACKNLVDCANKAGGRDNITALIINM